MCSNTSGFEHVTIEFGAGVKPKREILFWKVHFYNFVGLSKGPCSAILILIHEEDTEVQGRAHGTGFARKQTERKMAI